MAMLSKSKWWKWILKCRHLENPQQTIASTSRDPSLVCVPEVDPGKALFGGMSSCCQSSVSFASTDSAAAAGHAAIVGVTSGVQAFSLCQGQVEGALQREN